MRRINLFLALLLIFSGLNITLHPISAQEDDPAEAINQLARAVHIQNLRTNAVTRWTGGDLGRLNGSQLASEAGEVFNNWRFRDLYDDMVSVGPEDMEKPVLINMWASWCGPCRFEFPFLTDYALNRETSYDLWFVNTNDTTEAAARRFLRSQEDGIQVYLDEDDLFNADVGVTVLPTTLLIDTDGTLLAAHSGIVTPTVMDFFEAVAAHPGIGALDTSTVEVGELVANIEIPSADSATAIVMGQQVAGAIDDAVWQHNYSFAGEKDTEITIQMNSTDQDFDAYLVLIGPDGTRLAENDDGPAPPNAYIKTTLPEDGTYFIVATRFLENEGFSQGGFTLSLTQGEVDTSPASSASELQPNIPISGRLTPDRRQDNYLLPASEGQSVTFILEHDNTEEYLNFQVRIGAGERIVPFTQTVDGYLEVEVVMPQTADYSVYVSRPQRAEADAITYTLTVETIVQVDDLGGSDDEAEAADASTSEDEDEASNSTDDEEDSVPDSDEAPIDENAEDSDSETVTPPRVQAGEITYGDVLIFEISNRDTSAEYTFFGERGDVVTISMMSLHENLDTMLFLYGPTGALFAANDDNGDTTDSEIPGYELPMSGIYTIVATRYGGESFGSSGDFELALRLHETPVSRPPAGDVTLTEGSSLEDGSVVQADIDQDHHEVRYTFDGQAGQEVTVTMSAIDGSLDTYLSLYDDAGNQIAFNDDSAPGKIAESRLENIHLVADGTYTIVASRYGGETGRTTGTYELKLDIHR